MTGIRKRRSRAGSMPWQNGTERENADNAIIVLATDMSVPFKIDITSLSIAVGQYGLPIDLALRDLVEGGSPTPRQMGGREGQALEEIELVVQRFIYAMLIKIVERVRRGASMADALEAQAIEVTRITEDAREELRTEKGQ